MIHRENGHPKGQKPMASRPVRLLRPALFGPNIVRHPDQKLIQRGSGFQH